MVLQVCTMKALFYSMNNQISLANIYCQWRDI